MARSKRSMPSSLEMLLDTMCNTFGGVMFIAISLVVVLTMAGTATEALEEAQDITEMKKSLSELKKLLADKLNDSAEKERLREILEKDPAKKRLCELAALESELEKLRIETAASEAANKVTALEILRAGNKTAELEKRIADIEKANSEIVKQTEIERKNLSALEEKLSATSQAEISFKFFAPSSEAPYFILIKENRAWRVGPVLDSTGLLKPEDDVAYRLENTGKVVFCTPLPATGVNILENGALSPEFEALLNNLPKDRVPDFAVAPDSAKDFSEAREIMKKRFLKHGITTDYTGGEFTYTFVENVQYEY